jgi:hypothetical protein
LDDLRFQQMRESEALERLEKIRGRLAELVNVPYGEEEIAVDVQSVQERVNSQSEKRGCLCIRPNGWRILIEVSYDHLFTNPN